MLPDSPLLAICVAAKEQDEEKRSLLSFQTPELCEPTEVLKKALHTVAEKVFNKASLAGVQESRWFDALAPGSSHRIHLSWRQCKLLVERGASRSKSKSQTAPPPFFLFFATAAAQWFRNNFRGQSFYIWSKVMECRMVYLVNFLIGQAEMSIWLTRRNQCHTYIKRSCVIKNSLLFGESVVSCELENFLF